MIRNSSATQLLAGLIVTGLTLLLVAAVPASADKPIKIGLIDTYSGQPAIFTKSALAGWKMVVDDFNAKGGLNGRKVEIVTFDDQYDPNKALQGARELVQVQDVDFLGGFSSTDCAMAVSNFAKENKKILMVHIARSERITRDKGHSYVFSSVNPADVLGRATAKYAAHTGYLKWYILGDDSEYGRSYGGAFWTEFKKRNPKAEKVGEAFVDVNATDYTSYIYEIKEKKPTAVCVVLGLKGLISFTKQAKAAGLFSTVRVFLNGLGDPFFAAVLKDDMPTENAFGSAGFLWYWPKTKEVRDFVSQYTAVVKKETKEERILPPGYAAFGGYAAAKFLVEAMTKAKSSDTEQVVKAMEGLTIETATGRITMRACDHQVASPMNWGRLQKIEGLPMPGLLTPQMQVLDEFLPTCDEVMRMRERSE